MKGVYKRILFITLFVTIYSCTKDDLGGGGSNCYSCTVATQSLDVCLKEDSDFLVDGETVANPNNASLEEYIRAIEANPNNDPALEGISCERK